VAAEHFVSAGVHRRLSAALDAATPDQEAPRVLVGLARGSRHELGVLAFAAVLARAGLNVGYVGGDVPPDGWVVAVTSSDPAAVVLGVPNLDDVAPVRDVVAALGAVRPDLPVLLGGGHQEQIGAGEVLGHSLTQASDQLYARLVDPGGG
jgi:methanogenic corrinoid protein MtbC1